MLPSSENHLEMKPLLRIRRAHGAPEVAATERANARETTTFVRRVRECCRSGHKGMRAVIRHAEGNARSGGFRLQNERSPGAINTGAPRKVFQCLVYP